MSDTSERNSEKLNDKDNATKSEIEGNSDMSEDAPTGSEGSSFDQAEDLPKALIATNVDITVFDDTEEKASFEDIFRFYDAESFAYLKNFRRVRICFATAMDAATARIELHEKEILGSTVKLYFAQPPVPSDDLAKNPHLEPPPPVKQFLISPPSSPPVGWEPCNEATPVINYDLLQALAKLSPGEVHELHPAEGDKPSIVVHVCEGGQSDSTQRKPIIQTKCPERR
ncbi:calcipressin-2-like [Ptychodera flava]|uniref:calcipressin-2-like n=1 Tax=Ptychodera flava TaxID=63121 RepID=UPI00396A9B8F